MATIRNAARWNNNFNPIYGNLYGWTIADLDPAIAESKNVLDNVSTDTTGSISVTGANGVQILCEFSDATTTCSIDLVDVATSTTLYTWTNISNANKDQMYYSYFTSRVLLEGDAVTVRAYNFTGAGTVYVDLVPTS